MTAGDEAAGTAGDEAAGTAGEEAGGTAGEEAVGNNEGAIFNSSTDVEVLIGGCYVTARIERANICTCKHITLTISACILHECRMLLCHFQLYLDMEVEKKSPAPSTDKRATLRRLSSMLDKYKYVEKPVAIEVAAQDLSKKTCREVDSLPAEMVVDEKGDENEQQSRPTEEPNDVEEPTVDNATEDDTGTVSFKNSCKMYM